jgi:predicted acyltransferase
VENTISVSRLYSIDLFRGLAIVLMVLANFLGGVVQIPAWLKHAPDVGLTVIDLVAPFFIFAIALTFGLSWQRRSARVGKGPAYQHFILRALAIIGVGAILSAGERLLGMNNGVMDWGVLQTIGVSILVALLLVDRSSGVRLAAGLALLVVYQVLLDRYWLDMVFNSPHGGLLGSPGWAAMLLLGMLLADIYHQRRGAYFWAVLAVMAVGLALAFWIPVSKNRVSASYVLLSLGISGLMFGLIDLLVNRWKLHLGLLVAWGLNPLALYLLHFLLLGIMVLPGIPLWYDQAPLWLTILQALGLLAILSWAALWFEKRGWLLAL